MEFTFFAPFSENSPKMPDFACRWRPFFRVEEGLQGVVFAKKRVFRKFFLTDIQRVAKKMHFFWQEEEQPIGKNAIFAVPIERETEARRLGEFIERMRKDVANTQGKFLKRFASDEVGTDKKREEIK